MDNGNGQGTHTALERHVEQRTVHKVAIGIGTVQDYHFTIEFTASTHQLEHGDVVGIEA